MRWNKKVYHVHVNMHHGAHTRYEETPSKPRRELADEGERREPGLGESVSQTSHTGIGRMSASPCLLSMPAFR